VVTGWGKSVENSIGMKLVRIPRGTFTMGSPASEDRHDKAEEQHEVEITKDFWLGVHEATQQQFRAVMGKNPSWFSADGSGKDQVKGLDTGDFPVENVSYEDAVAFCRKLSALPAEKKVGRKHRLPTEAEWEYSCRGRASSYQVFHFGHSLTSRQANFDGRYPYGAGDKATLLDRSCSVGQYGTNRFGLYDMHGNVMEWCSDWYDKDYYGKSPRRDPQGPSEGANRVLRGGSWAHAGLSCRSAVRDRDRPDTRLFYLGFRVAIVPAGR
jgi:formylglycine-generating enzyme required for sulfatase activity